MSPFTAIEAVRGSIMEENSMLCLLDSRRKQDLIALFFAIIVVLLVFQDALRRIWHPFGYIDEAVALLGLLYSGLVLLTGKGNVSWKQVLLPIISLGVFVASGLLGNVLYRYQPWKSVVIDLYTNLKFFFAINTGFLFLHLLPWETLKQQANLCARSATAYLFAVFLLDRALHIFDGQVRHGIRSAELFFTHPSYLAGAVVFLLCLMAAFFENKNRIFILMDLVMIAFTLRSKAIVSAMVFVALWAFLVIWKKEMKRWHLVILGIAGVAVAWPKIHYYFIELHNWSARSVLLITALIIMKDYFPIGTGFGTYASSEAAKHYSPVYEKYGFQNNWELRNVADRANTKRLIEKFDIPRHDLWGGPYLNDSFWPIIFGQTGVLGTAAYVTAMGSLSYRCWKLKDASFYSFATVMYIWFHLLICSIAEPAFNNPTAVPLALVMGMVLAAAAKSEKTDV